MFTDEAGAYIHRFTCHKLTTKVVLEPVSLCSIALMDACNEFFLGGNLDAPRGLHYLSQVLNLVNGRLRSKDALNDSTLALVVSLILQEEMRNEMSRADVHFAGLKKMIQLRGGLEQLEGNKTLVLKVCKYAFPSFCLPLGHSPKIIRTEWTYVTHSPMELRLLFPEMRCPIPPNVRNKQPSTRPKA